MDQSDVVGRAWTSFGPLWQHHSKRERLACVTDFVRWRLGLLDHYLNVDFARAERVIFVCKGNICRSAYAEARFNQLVGGAVSAGTEALDGKAANVDAIRIAALRGVDLHQHRTQNVNALQYGSKDLLVCMEKRHADVVSSMVDGGGGQILLLGGMLGHPRVSDPYGRSDAYFGFVFDQIDHSLERLVALMSPKSRDLLPS